MGIVGPIQVCLRIPSGTSAAVPIPSEFGQKVYKLNVFPLKELRQSLIRMLQLEIAFSRSQGVIDLTIVWKYHYEHSGPNRFNSCIQLSQVVEMLFPGVLQPGKLSNGLKGFY